LEFTTPKGLQITPRDQKEKKNREEHKKKGKKVGKKVHYFEVLYRVFRREKTPPPG